MNKFNICLRRIITINLLIPFFHSIRLKKDKFETVLSLIIQKKQRVDLLVLFLLWLSISIYIIIFIRQSFFLYHREALTAYDLGIYDQSVWLISRFHFPFVTVRGLPVFADHFDPILYLFAPFYWIWDSPKMLLIIQTLAIAFGAFPVYALTRRITGLPPIGLLFALCYLCYPPLEWSNTFDFHPEIFATPLLLGAFYYLISNRPRPYFILLTMSLLTKESAGLSIVLLGIYALSVNRRVGWLTIGMGTAGLGIALLVLQVYHNGHPSPYFWLYFHYGNSPIQVIQTLLLHPFGVARSINSETTRRYLFELFFPLFFLPLLSPKVLALASPAILANLLSSRDCMHTIYYQYTAFITPFVLIASIIGFNRLHRWGGSFITAFLIINMIVSITWGFSEGPFLITSWPLTTPVTATQAEQDNCIFRLIPADASVSAQSGLIPHLGHRCHIYLFPNPFYHVAYGNNIQALEQEVGIDYPAYLSKKIAHSMNSSSIDYILLQPRGCVFPMLKKNIWPLLVSMLHSPNYGVIAVNGDTILLQRGANHRDGLILLAAGSGIPVLKYINSDKSLKTYLAAFL